MKRNIDRFPQDFLIKPNFSELAALRLQIVTLDNSSHENYIFKHAPYLFTENGVAMLSSILQSKQAIQVNITIMRTFTKLRSFLLMENEITSRVDKLEDGTNKLFKIVFQRLDEIDDKLTPKLSQNRKKIGLKD